MPDDEQQQMDKNSRNEGQNQAFLDFGLKLDLKSAEYHGRHHQIERYFGQDHALLRFHNLQFNQQVTQYHDEKQLDNFPHQ